MVVVSGDDQVDTVGTELPSPLVVRVLDENGLRVPNQIVNFVVTAGGGSVFAGSALTNAEGEARERWTLGKVAADSQRVEARAVNSTTGAAIVFGTFRATAVAGPATKLKKASADSGSATIGTDVTVKPSVRVTDQYDNPVSGTSVTFAVASGGGSVTGGSAVTNGSGIATVGGWTLGTTAGANTLTAAANGLQESPITFFATSVGASHLALSTPAGGAASGAAFMTQPVVAFRSPAGQTVAAINGVTVTMTVSGNGRIVGTATAVAASGIAWFSNVGIHGTAGVQYMLTFSAPGVTPATQGITPTPGAATQLVLTTNAAGAASGAAFATQPVVEIRDEAHNKIASNNGTVVTMTVSGATTVGTATATSSSGVATFSNVGISGTVGTKTLTFSASGVASATQTISLTAGAVATVTVSPGSASLFINDVQFSATAKDAAGNTVNGTVSWTIAPSGLASVSVSGLVTPVSEGTATLSAAVGGTTGTATVTVLPFTFSALEAGGYHTCGLANGGRAYCWGDNNAGQLGDGTQTGRVKRVAVLGGHVFTTLTVRGRHSCALTSAGAVYCWGQYNHDQPGNAVSRYSPVLVNTSGIAFDTLSVGSDHTCGLTASGTAYCWGANDDGQLGDGSVNDRSTPVLVSGGYTFEAIAAGGYHTCGLTAANVVYCWGKNDNGRLGDGTVTKRNQPVAVQGQFVGVVAGDAHTCAWNASGAAYCWGWNRNGQLGDASLTDRHVPTLVQGGLEFTALAGGSEHTCGVTGTTAARCWGWNDGSNGLPGMGGQIGDGSRINRPSPTAVQGGLSFRSLSAGYGHTCGRTTSNVAYCWGFNEPGGSGSSDGGQLGDGTTTNRLTPVPVVRR